ncbi:MAG: hypothetical protein LBP73_07125 [Clostridiales Family XIII bacterium]|jgi:hypothetical protein|nr:hypothetical protein [Clostridiales Family XIII bacterium]
MRGFYEDYRRQKQIGGVGSVPVPTHGGAGAAVVFFGKLFAAVLYAAATALSCVGLTTLINKPLRDMLFDIARSAFFGG